MSLSIAGALPVNNTSLEHYLAEVNAMPMLSAEQEFDLATRFRRENDLDAARQLVVSHLRFVVKVARGYAGYGLPQADLIQEGSIGLMKAVKRYDPEVGVRLVSFAVHWIRAEIHEFILRNWRIVKVATTKAQRKLFFNLRSSRKRLGWMNQEEVEEVADELGVKPEEVKRMEARMNAYDQSFDGPAQTGEDDDLTAPARTLSDPESSVETIVADAESAETRIRALADALGALDDRSREIVTRRWLNEDGKDTLHTLAAEFGVSAERIRQIEKAALKKIRATLEGADESTAGRVLPEFA